VKNLKEKLNNLSVLVFGDMYLDRDCIGDFEGKSKEDENMPILKVHTEKYQPGGAGNLASCFAALGVKTTVVGLWGEKDDINRQILEQCFKNRGIDTSYMVESGKTPVFGKFYTQDGNHIFRYDVIYENMNDRVEKLLIESINPISHNKFNFVACADYNNSGIRDMVCENILKSILRMKISKFATGRKNIDKFKGFNCLLLNEEEFLRQAFLDNDIRIQFSLRQYEDDFLINKFGVNSLVVTSENGAIGIDVNTNQFESKSKKLKGNIDTCGCGDMFYAMYSSCIMAHYGMKESLDLANLTAGMVAKKLFGAAQISIDELINNSQ